MVSGGIASILKKLVARDEAQFFEEIYDQIDSSGKCHGIKPGTLYYQGMSFEKYKMTYSLPSPNHIMLCTRLSINHQGNFEGEKELEIALCADDDGAPFFNHYLFKKSRSGIIIAEDKKREYTVHSIRQPDQTLTPISDSLYSVVCRKIKEKMPAKDAIQELVGIYAGKLS